ncbi:hypothetical protein AB0H73_18870 [Streptomyces olivoreticuli]
MYSRPTPQPPEGGPVEIVEQAAKLLGVDPALVPASIRTVQEDKRRACASAETAWAAVRVLTSDRTRQGAA